MSKLKYLLAMVLIGSVIMTGCGGGGGGDTQASSGSSSTIEAATDGYVFEVSGTDVIMNAKTDSILQSIGEEKEYFEAESCAFKGLDKTYTYSGFRLYTYPVDDVDYVLSVELMDDSVSTTEGVSLGDTKEEVMTTYGEGGEETDTSLTYTKGASQIKFIFDSDDVINSIEYLAVTD